MCNDGENKRTIVKGSNFNVKAFHHLKHGDFSAIDEKGVESVLEEGNIWLSVSSRTTCMKAFEVCTSLRIPRHDFKVSNGWAVRFVHPDGLVLRCRVSAKASH